jgi:hypothetical protein
MSKVAFFKKKQGANLIKRHTPDAISALAEEGLGCDFSRISRIAYLYC